MTTAATDSELMARVAGGDGEAFAELYRRFGRPVLGMATRRLGDDGWAEDVTQETFAAVWRSARSYRAERGSVSAWLFGVARNAIVDRARARHEPPAGEVAEEPSPETGPEGEAEAAWVAWRVHAALERLPDRERIVLELAYFSGLSQSEIASYLDVPLGTVKTRTRAGLARLSGLLAEVER
jgi:RNA polymerase sigma-70 factor (ECF subfamily)